DRKILVRRPCQYREVLVADGKATVEGKPEVSATLGVQIGNAAVPSVAHGNLASGEDLDRLSTARPPMDVFLDLVELGESSIYATGRIQRLYYLVRRHSVRHEGNLKGIDTIDHPPLAWPSLNIPEIGPALRRVVAED